MFHLDIFQPGFFVNEAVVVPRYGLSCSHQHSTPTLNLRGRMSNLVTGIAGAEIRRGDMVKLVDGELLPALLWEKNVGAAAEDIPRDTRAYSLHKSYWKVMPPGFRSF